MAESFERTDSLVSKDPDYFEAPEWARTEPVLPSPTDSARRTQWAENVVPPTHNHRTLIVCFDGTGDQFDADNSNVVQFVSLLKKDNKREQMVYYQAGIGTSAGGPGFLNPIVNQFSKMLDRAIAWNLAMHTQAGYEFLMQNYEYGDKICIFGFSRGAYTARSLAGMLTKVGLLPADNREQVPFAYKMYTQDDAFGWEQSRAFKKTFSVHVDIEFLGVWDTVNSVGLVPHQLPFTISNKSIRYFRHAVSIDERRAKFKANLWPSWDRASDFSRRIDAENKEFSDKTEDTDVLEVWFSGCHCDVGGGAVKNGTRHALARIPLRWMIRQCFLAKTGIMFNAGLLKTVGLDSASLYPLVKPRPEALTIDKIDRTRLTCKEGQITIVDENIALTEEEEDIADALSPINDMLSLSHAWWICEILPMKQRCFTEDGSWKWKWIPNLATGRYLPQHDDYKFHVHRSVQTRLNDHHQVVPGKKYTPKAMPWGKANPIWMA